MLQIQALESRAQTDAVVFLDKENNRPEFRNAEAAGIFKQGN